MTQYDELVKAAMEKLEDPDIFVKACEELDSWNGYLNNNRLCDMCELDDFYYGCKATDLIEKLTKDFNIADDYFYYSIYGLESTSESKFDFYSYYTDTSEIFDNVLQYANKIDLQWIDADFSELIDQIINFND